MPSSRLRKRPSVDVPVSPQSKPMHSPTSPEPKPRSSQEPYPVPSSNPASQYTLMEKLGVGSFGTVYKAMHNETKQIVAIKQIGASLRPLPHWALFALADEASTSSGSSLSLCVQISKIQMTIFLKYNRKLPIWHNMSRNSSLAIMAPLLSTISSGS